MEIAGVGNEGSLLFCFRSRLSFFCRKQQLLVHLLTNKIARSHSLKLQLNFDDTLMLFLAQHAVL